MCPDENTLAAMIQGFLAPAEVRSVEDHLDGCPTCMEVVITLADLLSVEAGAAVVPRIGRYEILATLGSGGQGLVFAAKDPELEREVALKILRPDRTADTERLRAEARRLAALSHPNVVAVFEIGPHAGGVYLVTELARGGTLRTWTSVPRPWRAVVERYLQAGRGLAAAHRAGLVHRDFKPENVVLHDDGRAMLTDFGLASTASGARGIAGTPAYLAPEVTRGAPADARSDQFAYCASLFEALHGARPFPGTTTSEIAEAAERGVLPARRGSAPAAVTRVVVQGLAADPGARHPDLETLLDRLERATRRPRYRSAGLAAGVATAAALVWAWSFLPPSAVPVVALAPPARQVVTPVVDRCGTAERAVPIEPPCDGVACVAGPMRDLHEVQACYEAARDCDGVRRVLGRIADLVPSAPRAEILAGSYACAPLDVHGQALWVSRWSVNDCLVDRQTCLALGSRVRTLRDRTTDAALHEQLWILQRSVVVNLQSAWGDRPAALAEARRAVATFRPKGLRPEDLLGDTG